MNAEKSILCVREENDNIIFCIVVQNKNRKKLRTRVLYKVEKGERLYFLYSIVLSALLRTPLILNKASVA